MIVEADPLEDSLLHGYRAQLEHYDRAVAILGTARADSHSDAIQGNPWAHDLLACLQEAATADAAMSGNVAAWRETGRKPAEALKDVLELLTQRIRVLSEEINGQISNVRQGQQALASDIDEFIQNRRMLQAYVKHR